MAKVTAPLLSFGAAGTIANTQTYAVWRGIHYVRQRVIPANPQTTAQNLTRNLFRALTDAWKFIGADATKPWTAYAKGQPFTDRNAYLGQNTKAMRGDANCSAYVGSPGALGGFPPAAMTVANDAALDQLTLTFTYPTLPTGWAVSKIVGTCFKQQAAAEDLTGPFFTGTAAAPATTLTLAGLPHTQANVASGWIEYTRPDGSTAYGPSITAVAAAT